MRFFFDSIKNNYAFFRTYKYNICAFIIFLFMAVIYIWNAFNVPFGSGYDEIGHAAYIRSIAKYNFIPDPLSGWATFHPPFYYLISSFIWKLMEPLGPLAVIVSIRMVSCLSIILTGLLSYILLKKLNFPNSVVLMSTSILLSLPVTQMAASWIGNEAFTTAISSVACVTAVLMTKKEDDPKLAFFAGIFSGLAFASKYTGMITIIGLFAANYNLSTHWFRIRNFIFSIIGFILIATPVIYRNINADGTIFPMTRDLAPIAKLEAKTQVNRSVWNYLTFNFKCLSKPIIYNYENKAYNKHMESVWGLTYSGLWYDPFEHRLPEIETMGMAKLLPWLGMCPTIILLIGFFDAIIDLIRSKLDQAWLPLLAISIFGLLLYIYWTWHAHTLMAVKGSYLLPLILSAAAFFARGLHKINVKIRFAMIMLCIFSVLMNGIVFMEGLFYSTPQNYNNILIYGWMNIAYEMPYSGIYETIIWFITGR